MRKTRLVRGKVAYSPQQNGAKRVLLSSCFFYLFLTTHLPVRKSRLLSVDLDGERAAADLGSGLRRQKRQNPCS